MKKSTRLFLKIAIGCIGWTLFSAAMLWLTRETDLPSQSAFADQLNVFWYIMIHSGMILAFFILGAIYWRQFMYTMLGFASGFTLMFDVMGYRWPHNISTALIFLIASYCIIVYEKYDKTFYTVLCSVLGIIFVLSVTKTIGLSVYGIEYIVEWVFGTIMIKRIINTLVTDKKQQSVNELF